MDVQYPLAFHQSYAAIIHASYSLAIFYFVFFAMVSFICVVPLCTSIFRHLAVCNTAEFMLCWCVL